MVLASCGDDDSASAGESSGALSIEASFYPLQWMAEQVGGDHVEVAVLTKPGAEPHDLELTPRDVARIRTPTSSCTSPGFQPAVDDAVDEVDDGNAFDAAPRRRPRPHVHADRGGRGAHRRGRRDRPALLARPHAAGRRRRRLRRRSWPSSTRPTPTTTAANAAALGDELAALDAELEAGLADCERQHGPGHQPQRVRLPGPPLRPEPGRHHRADPRGGALARATWRRSADFVEEPRRPHHLLRDAGEPRHRRDGRRARPVPTPPCSIRSKASTTSPRAPTTSR